MTRTNNSKTTKLKFLLTLFLVGLMCFSLFFTVACSNEDQSTSKDPTYSYTETDDGLLKNASFSYGTVGTALSSFPKTSFSGWSLSKDSSAKSGVIDVTDNGWEQLMNTLYSDSGILSYVKEVNDFTNSDIIDAIKTENNTETTPTSTEIKEYIVNKYFLGANKTFTNPQTHSNDLDNKIFMLNNYKSSRIGFGSIQKLTSSTEIVLNKGEYAKVSVYVKTANLNTEITDNIYGKEIGANIRITNSFNNKQQATFGIYNIVAEDWTEYSFYVKADDVYDTKFTLSLGLGYEFDVYNRYYAEGTAFFDDIKVEHVSVDDFDTLNPAVSTYKMAYNNEKHIVVEADTIVNIPLYDMSLDIYNDLPAGYIQNLGVSAYTEHNYTSSSTGSNGKPCNDSSATVSSVVLNDETIPYGISDALEVNVNKASYTIKLNSSDFNVAPENYAYVSFFIKNKLSDLYASKITIDVFDVNGSIVEKHPAVATFLNVGDKWQKCSILIKNNFDKDDIASLTRSFYIEIVVGPTSVKTQNAIDYATGTVYFTSPILAKGATYQWQDEENEIETANYDYYNLLTANASGSASLYAGSESDFAADETDSEKYSLTVAPSDIGVIYNKPANPKNFNGIVQDHFYIDETSTIYALNTNENAGLINTKYLSNYSYGQDLIEALNHSDTKNVQPLMIYNANDDCYGYIGNSNTIPTSSYAKISVKVRVYGDAVAYIYLVDTSEAYKSVMTFNDFTVNTDGLNTISGQEIIGSNKKLEFKVTSNMMQDDGWLTVEFYIGTGATSKDFRVEMWNGSRDGVTSKGFVFFNDVNIITSSAFSEPTRWQDALSTSGTPLFNQTFDDGNLLMYRRELTDLEKQFNSETDTNEIVSYRPNYVWAQNDSLIYAIYNTIDPVAVDPYESNNNDDENDSDEHTHVDPSAFWLSFSSILLGVALVLAIIALFIKNALRKRKANANDAKSHFTVTSRTRKTSSTKAKKQEKTVKDIDESPVPAEEPIMEDEAQEIPTEEQTLDSYVYGEVQDFGESNTNQEDLDN